MSKAGQIKQSDAEAAQTAVVMAIRAAADGGTIMLNLGGED
jgi:flagellar motor switch protein FliG